MCVLSVSAWAKDKAATVYHCEQDGVAVFSQVPCELNAQSMVIKPSQGEGLTVEQANTKIKALQDSMQEYVNQQDIEQQIAQHHRRIDQLKNELQQQLTQLKQRRFRTATMRDEAFNLAEKQYQAKVKVHHEAIKRLHERDKKRSQQ